MLLAKLIDEGDVNVAVEFGDFVYERLRLVHLRTLDHLIAKALYLVGVVYEKASKLGDLRTRMFEAYKSATLRND